MNINWLVVEEENFFTLGIEYIYLLHQLVENIHSRRLQGDYGIPSVMVDSVTEGRIQSVLAAKETADGWWLLEESSGTNPVQTWVPPRRAPASPPSEGVHSCPSRLDANITTGVSRNSRASRLARLAESARIQASEPLPEA